MAQQIINTGAAANDGTGDPLRTAFTETNSNFTEIYTAGPVNSNVRITNNTILTLNTNGNLVLAPNGTGRVVANVDVVPNTANVRNLGASTQRWSTVYAQYLDISANTTFGRDLTVGGNLTVTGDIVQVGNIITDAKTIQLANTASTANAAAGSGVTVGANDNIATLLYNSTGNVWTMNIGVSTVGNVTAPYFIGNGSQLTGLPVPYGNSNVVTLLAGFGSNTITTTGNVSGGYFIGNGSTLANIAGANVSGTVANATYATTAGSATTAGTVTTAAQGNITSVGVLTSLSATGNVTAGNVLTSAEVIASGVIQTGTGFSTGGYLSVNGSTDLHDTNIIGTLSVNTIRSDDSTVVKIQDGAEIDGDTLVNGNVTAGYFIGDGSQLTGISSTGNLAVIGTTIVIDADAPETSIYISPSGEGYAYFELPNNATANTVNTGLWNAAGNVEIGAGNVSNAGPTYAWLFGNNGNLSLPRGGIVYETNIPFGSLEGNTIALKPAGGTDSDQQLLIYPTITPGTDVNHLHLTSGNLYNTELFLGNDDLYVKLANTGNVVINSNNGVGNAAQWTFATNGTTVFPGSLTGSGASPAPSINGFGSINSITVSASGNVTGNYILGNGSQLTSLPAPGVAQDITSVGDMSIMTYDGNLKYASYATVEPATGTIKSAGNVSATGNITGAYIFGNGSQLTGLPATYGNANVATFLAAYGSNTISTSGNITAGNFVGNISITGNVVGTQPNVTLVAGSYSTVFDNTGVATFPGNVSTSGTFVGSGAGLTEVALKTTGSWTVATGTNTYSITVPDNGAYQMWVRGNIPNGIITYLATISVTNSNVPVLGTQRGYNYTGGGSPILLVTMPTQIIGAEGTISTAVISGTTNNVFDFVISNTSGTPQTIFWGYVTLS